VRIITNRYDEKCSILKLRHPNASPIKLILKSQKSRFRQLIKRSISQRGKYIIRLFRRHCPTKTETSATRTRLSHPIKINLPFTRKYRTITQVIKSTTANNSIAHGNAVGRRSRSSDPVCSACPPVRAGGQAEHTMGTYVQRIPELLLHRRFTHLVFRYAKNSQKYEIQHATG